jgi:hypothetical protein
LRATSSNRKIFQRLRLEFEMYIYWETDKIPAVKN